MFNLIATNMYKHHLIELRPFSNPLCSATVMLVTYIDDKDRKGKKIQPEVKKWIFKSLKNWLERPIYVFSSHQTVVEVIKVLSVAMTSLPEMARTKKFH